LPLVGGNGKRTGTDGIALIAELPRALLFSKSPPAWRSERKSNSR
jgi:hypothetical protein